MKTNGTPQSLLQLQHQLFVQGRASRPLPDVTSWLVDRRNLDAAWTRVASTDGANTAGLDGETAASVAGRNQSWLGAIADGLVKGTWRPAPPRWVQFPKPSGSGMRTIGILTLRDRVVHACLKQVLEPLLDPSFSADSFGFRPGRSVAGALDTAVRLLSGDDAGPFTYAVRLDIADCFDTIDHDLLLVRIAQFVGDEHVQQLLARLLAAAGTTVRHWWTKRTCGVVQGSSLSPLLCNLYLDDLDQWLAAVGKDSEGAVRALRYADDLLILARDRRWAYQAVRETHAALKRLRQQLRVDKTQLVPVAEGFEWLGVRLRPRPEGWSGRSRFGYLVPDAKVREMLDRLSEMTAPPSSRIDASAFDLGRWIVSVNEQLRDWRHVYQFADNAPHVFQTLDEHTQEQIAELLHSVTGRRRGELIREYRIRLPRGFSTWQVDGHRLAVLSSLAPQAPSHLTRRPPWASSRRSADRQAVIGDQ